MNRFAYRYFNNQVYFNIDNVKRKCLNIFVALKFNKYLTDPVQPGLFYKHLYNQLIKWATHPL